MKSERNIPWKQVCLPKRDGGLSFMDIAIFNNALLVRQFWRLHCYPNSLLARSLKAKYFSHESSWDTKVGSNPSFPGKYMECQLHC